ncbi:MAG: hypothetical protein AB8U44_01290 [Aaplasma endosymbiont of Hyalomma asiaticum]
MSPERRVLLVCVRLIEKIRSILGAVVHETIYVDCTVANIRIAVESAIERLNSAHRILSVGKRLPIEGYISIVSEHLFMLLCMAMGKLSVVMRDLRFSHSSYPYAATVDLLIDQSVVLLSKTMESLQTHCLLENRCFYTRRHSPATVAYFDRVVSRAHTCVTAFVDALNTVHILVECPPTEKETMLYSTATFVCMSKLLKEVYVWNRGVSYSIAASLTKAADTQGELLRSLIAGANATDAEASLAASVAYNALFKFVQEVSYLCGINIAHTPNDRCVVDYALLRSISALGLMWNLCRKEGLESSSFAKGILKVRCLVYSIEDLSRKRPYSTRNSTEIHAYFAIVSQVDTALSQICMLTDGPFSIDEHKFSELIQRSTDALGEIYDVFSQRIRKIEGLEYSRDAAEGHGIRVGEEICPTSSPQQLKEVIPYRERSCNCHSTIQERRDSRRPFCVGIMLCFILFSTLCYIVGLVKGIVGYATRSVFHAGYYGNRDTTGTFTDIPESTRITGVTVDDAFELSNEHSGC